MALSPNAVAAVDVQDVARKALQAEQEIDARMSVGASVIPIWYALHRSEQAVGAEIIRRYAATGWVVEWVLGEGGAPDCLVFRPAERIGD